MDAITADYSSKKYLTYASMTLGSVSDYTSELKIHNTKERNTLKYHTKLSKVKVKNIEELTTLAGKQF